jgi:hypothetical protein
VLTWKDDLLIEGEAPPGAPHRLILSNLGLFEMLRQSAIPRGEPRVYPAINSPWRQSDIGCSLI